jgi:hypothetical protein
MSDVYRSSGEAGMALAGICLLVLCLLLAVLPGMGPCQPSHGDAAPSGDPAAAETPVSATDGQNKAVEAARIELSKSIHVDVAFLSAESIEPAWWPDSCLGLGRLDETCREVRTPGFCIVLRAGGYRFIYRTDLSGENVRLQDLITNPD